MNVFRCEEVERKEGEGNVVAREGGVEFGEGGKEEGGEGEDLITVSIYYHFSHIAASFFSALLLLFTDD